MHAMEDAAKLVLLSVGLLLLVTAAVVVTVYAAEPLTIEQAVRISLKNNLGLRAADAQVEAAQAGVLKCNAGFLPKVTLSETWSKSDNPLMVFGAKLNQEIVSVPDFNPAVINNPEPASNGNTRLHVMQPVFNYGKE